MKNTAKKLLTSQENKRLKTNRINQKLKIQIEIIIDLINATSKDKCGQNKAVQQIINQASQQEEQLEKFENLFEEEEEQLYDGQEVSPKETNEDKQQTELMLGQRQ